MKWLVILALIVGGILLGKYLYFKPKFVQGKKAPDFSVILKGGEAFSLSDLKGHYVLLDFWGSWCGPCRRENPEIVRLYNEYANANFENAKGFRVVNIGMETNQQSWERAIERDGLNWKYHFADFNRMQTSIGVEYGVREIPTKYLINPDGYIIGVNQSLEEIEAVLKDHLL